MIGWRDIAREPFRIFFPAAVLTGILAVGLWPLHFAGVVPFYPGISHAQLMAHGFFGGFTFGVLGTGLPRMLSVKPFHLAEVFMLLAIYTAMVLFNFAGKVTNAAIAVLVLLAAFLSGIIPRVVARKDMPPPGFVLVALALACLAGGAILSIVLGFLAIAIYPLNKVAVLHLTLVGGFAVLTFAVATRVAFGHSGNQALLAKPNRWLLIAVGLMLLGMATRISGDLFPAVRVSHYNLRRCRVDHWDDALGDLRPAETPDSRCRRILRRVLARKHERELPFQA